MYSNIMNPPFKIHILGLFKNGYLLETIVDYLEMASFNTVSVQSAGQCFQDQNRYNKIAYK